MLQLLAPHLQITRAEATSSAAGGYLYLYLLSKAFAILAMQMGKLSCNAYDGAGHCL